MALKKIVPEQQQARISVHISTDVRARIDALEVSAKEAGYKLDMSDELSGAVEKVVASNERAFAALKKEGK